MREDDRVTSNEELKHIERDDPNYITPSHYYGSNYQLLDVIEDQLSPLGVRGFMKGLILKYLYGIDENNALRRCKKAKYYLDELIIYLKNQGEFIPENNNLKPHYYNKGNIEVINIIEDQLTKEELKGFYTGMCIRYIVREYNKNKLEDLEKAKYYLDRFISNLEGGL